MDHVRPASKVFSVVDRVRDVEAQRAAAVATAAAPFDAELERLYAQLDQAGVSLGLPVVPAIANAGRAVNGHASSYRDDADCSADDDNDDDETESEADSVNLSKTDILLSTIRAGGPLNYAQLAARMYPNENPVRARKKVRSMMSSLKKLKRIRNIGVRGDKLWEVVR